MSTLKIFKTLILILVLSILAGCSDESYSPTSQSLTSEKKAEVNSEDNNIASIYHTIVILKPGQVQTYNYKNSGLYIFNSVQVLNCNWIKGRIEVSGQNPNEAVILGCNNKGLKLSEIKIINLGTEDVELDIFMSGSKAKISDPYIKELNLF